MKEFCSSVCQMDIHGKIREVLAETVRDDQGPARRSLSEADFLRALQRRGIIDDMMKDLHFTQVSQLFGCSFRPIFQIGFYFRSIFHSIHSKIEHLQCIDPLDSYVLLSKFAFSMD